MAPLLQGMSASPSMDSIEEGIPAASNAEAKGTNTVVKRQLSSRLSFVSKKYDVDGDGKLDAAERAMRDMDKEGLGYLTNDKVYTIFQEQLRMQKQLLMAKRIIIFCATLLIILAAANVGASFVAANLAKDTSTNNNVLVVKENGEVVQVDAHNYVFAVSPEDSRRDLGALVAGSDCSAGLCKIEPDAEAALEILRLCKTGLPVILNLTSSLFSADGTTEVLTVYHVCNYVGQEETITENSQRDGTVTNYNVTRSTASFEFQSNPADNAAPWLFSARHSS